MCPGVKSGSRALEASPDSGSALESSFFLLFFLEKKFRKFFDFGFPSEADAGVSVTSTAGIVPFCTSFWKLSGTLAGSLYQFKLWLDIYE